MRGGQSKLKSLLDVCAASCARFDMEREEGDPHLPVRILLCVISVIAYAFTKVGPGPVTGHFGGSGFIVENEKYKFDYAVNGASSFGGVLIGTGRQQGMSQGGVVAAVHYLDESSAAEFVRTQKPGRCTADFFNAHAQLKLLIPATPEVQKQLTALRFDDHSDTSSWRRFTLKGYCVSRANSMTIDGKPAVAPVNMFDNCTTVVTTGVEIEPQKPQQFAGR